MKAYICMLTILFLWVGLCSQDNINLQDAILQARENNLSLKSIKNELDAARWEMYNAKTQFLPKLNLNETAVFLDKQPGTTFMGQFFPISFQNYVVSSLQAEQILFAGGRIYNAYRLSNIQYDTMQNNYQKTLQDTDAKVIEYYYVILKTLSALDILNNHKALCEELLHTTQIMYQNGIGLQTDVMQWELRIIEIENQILLTENGLNSLKELWAMTLGLQDIYHIPLPEYVEISGVLQEIRDFSLLDNTTKSAQMDEYLETVKNTNFDIVNLQNAETSLNHLNRLAKADFLPTLFASYNYEIENDDKLDFQGDSSWQIVLNLSVPLFHSGRNYTYYKSQYYRVRSQRFNLQEANRGLEIAAKQAWYDFDSAVNTVIQSEKYSDLTERTLDITRNLYSQGRITNVALSDAQNSYLVAQIQFLNSVYDYIIIENKLQNFKGGER